MRRIYTWNCAYCQRNFETENYSQRYCSHSHRELAYRLRKAERLQDALAEQNVLTD